jgi:hypothetical protein
MKWYAAHLILYVRFKSGRQRHYPVWENIVLIRATTETAAMAKAEQRGHEAEGDCDGSFTWEGRSAEWVFAGVRKLMLCVDAEERPRHGTEVTYLELEVASKEALQKLVDGERVSVIRTGDTVPLEVEEPLPDRVASR